MLQLACFDLWCDHVPCFKGRWLFWRVWRLENPSNLAAVIMFLTQPKHPLLGQKKSSMMNCHSFIDVGSLSNWKWYLVEQDWDKSLPMIRYSKDLLDKLLGPIDRLKERPPGPDCLLLYYPVKLRKQICCRYFSSNTHLMLINCTWQVMIKIIC